MSYAEDLRNKIYGDICPENTVTAAIYARVSTNNLGQKESCDNQVAYAKYYISQHPNIKLVKVFIDDGISGKNDNNRPQYQEMLQMIKSGEIQVVIIKDYSRSNRSTNAFDLENILIENDATFINLANNHIDDLEDPDAALPRHIQYLVDAKYVRDQSRKGKITHQLRCKNKILSAKDISYGYIWDKINKSIIISAEQATVITIIFEEYVYRNGTPASIYRLLKSKGINLSERTISNILQDERYIGKFFINKRSSKLGTGRAKSKRFSLPKDQWVLIERPDLRIINDDLFIMAQRIRNSRQTIYAKQDKVTVQAHFQGTHNFSGKIFCSCCGKPYHFGYADRKSTIPIYRMRKHTDCECNINRLYEKDLEKIIRLALINAINQHEEACTHLEKVLTECIREIQNNGAEIKKLKSQKSAKEQKSDLLIDNLSADDLSDAAKTRIKTKINLLESEISELDKSISILESEKIDESYITDKVMNIKCAIADLKNFNVLDRDRILNYVDRIIVLKNGDLNIILKSGAIICYNQKNELVAPLLEKSAVMMRIQDARYSYTATYR